MEITRRNLIRSGLAVGSIAAVGGPVLAPLSARAVEGRRLHTTLAATLGRGSAGRGGYAPVVRKPGEAHLVRSDLGTPPQRGREQRRTAVLAFAHLTDVHVVDHQSPMRLEYTDRYDDQDQPGDPTVGLFSSAYRPHEMLSAHVADAMIQAINTVQVGPVTGAPLAFALQTGDNSDNSQYNEIRWSIDLLDGAPVRPDSGDHSRYEGVMEPSPWYYDRHYWHPEGTPLLKADDYARKDHGFPVVKGLLTASRRPFGAAGLNIPWYSAFGNHDGLVQGNFPRTLPLDAVSQGAVKVISPPAGTSIADVLNALRGNLLGLVDLLTLTPYAQVVTPDKGRRILTRKKIVEEHFRTSGTPVGHGFTAANRAAGTAYYTFDRGLVRFIVLDTVNPNGKDDGSLDTPQFNWLRAQLVAASDRAVVIASHHTLETMTNPLIGAGGDLSLRVLGDKVQALLLANPQVIAWVNGHTHRNQVWAHKRADGSGGFWEINTASHIDWPQQSRLVEIVDNHDGTLSIFTTMLDHAGPESYGGNLGSTVPLAGLSRELALNERQSRGSGREGAREARNVELVLRSPAAFA